MSTCRLVCAVLALGLVASAVPLRAQGQSPDVMLARAVAALEATETERGVELLRQLVATLPPTAPGALRRDAQLRLAVACGSLGLFDSATVHFQAAIGADPFATLDPEQFNPDLLAVFRAAKRATLALGVRAPPDTALAPRIERWPVSVAVTRPGTVRFRLARPGPAAGSRDTVIATAAVESLATIALLLPAGDGVASAAGAYRLAVDYSEPGGRTVAATLSLELTEQVADSAPHEPPPADSLYRLEVRWGAPSRASLARGIGLGVAAGAIPLLFANSQLRSADGRALTVGVAVSLAGLSGYFLGRPRQPLPENITYNRALRSAWEARNRAIAAANERRRGMALLRVRVVSQQ
ncbi:MAG TPA: hypothetical protein VEM13_02390 [Gemmatimonadales bacterium]|nr:hypothetical protein [Gemmatimonadales bacterium]